MSLYDETQGAVSADWLKAVWSLGAPPTASQDAYIGGTLAIYSYNDVTVNSIGVAYGNLLEIWKGTTFTAANGAALDPNDQGNSYGIAGTLSVDPGATFSVANTIVNTGTVFVGGAGSGNADMYLTGAVSFTGNGTVAVGGYLTGGTLQGEITGGGLANYGNTIEGVGLIGVSNLNNVLGAIVAEYAFSYELRITAPVFTNSATVTVDLGATLDLGIDGATQSMTNNGAFNMGDGISNGTTTTLAISGAYSIGGNGTLAFDYDGADIVSDGAAGDSLSLGAQATIRANHSGIIGNGHAGPDADNLTFTNYGFVAAQNLGTTLTIDTGGDIVSDPGGLILATINAIIVIDSPVQMGQYYILGNPAPAGGTLEANAGAIVEIASAVANGPPPGLHIMRQSSGQIVADILSTVIIEAGGSVAVPIQIAGASGNSTGGTVDLLAGGAITGTVNFVDPGGTLNLASTTGAVNASGNGGVVNLTNAQVNVSGGDEFVNFLAGGNDAATLSSTGGLWDNVSGSNGVVTLSNAWSGVVGAGDTVNFVSATSDIVSLWNATSAWDSVSGSNGTVYLSHAWSSVVGGGDAVYFQTGTDDIASLWNTGGVWDNVTGSNGTIYLSHAWSGVVGGGDKVDFVTGTDNIASLWNTGGVWDNVTGSNGTIYLSHAWSGVVGGGDAVYFATGTDDIASLWNTGGVWDNVYGSNGAVYLNNADSGVVGGGDTVNFAYGAGDTASLWNTNGAADTLNNLGGVTGTVLMSNAQAVVNGAGDTIDFTAAGADSVTVFGNNETFIAQPLVGLDSITGYNATDMFYLSAAQFGTNWTTFFNNDVSPSGGNTLIVDPNNHANQITLVGVAPGSLSQGNFHFG